jgi:hypothetical protein
MATLTKKDLLELLGHNQEYKPMTQKERDKEFRHMVCSDLVNEIHNNLIERRKLC